jgi:hypothetical protein
MAMVVMGKVVVVVTMHVVAVPIIAVPRGATMPAISIPTTHTGDMSAIAAEVAHVSSADVAEVGSAHVAHAAHVTQTAHVTHTAHVAPAVTSIGVTDHCGSKKQAACDGSNCNNVRFHDCTSLVAQSRPPLMQVNTQVEQKVCIGGKKVQFF